MKKLLGATTLMLALSSYASAATMTFDDYNFASADFLSRSYIEAGITAKGNAPLIEGFGRGGGDAIYIADGGWGGPTSLTFTMEGVFDAISFDLTPSIFNYFVGKTANEVLRGKASRSSFVNVRVQGYGEAGIKAVTSFNMGTVLEAQTYVLGTAFASLTSLVIGFEAVPAGFGQAVKLGPKRFGACTDSPCSRYTVDNVTLAPVPLPAGLAMMASAIAALTAAGRRRRSAAAI